MTDAPAPLDHLVDAVHATRVVVVGGGAAGLVAALECAKVGLAVTLFEAAPELGGTIRSAELDGIRLDLGPDGWTAGEGVRRLIDELGLGDRVTSADPATSWLVDAPGGAAPLPAEAVLGIPANAWDPAVRRVVGWSGVWRAYLDRLRPPLTIGQEQNLGRLVRRRMGDRVADRLVSPLTVGRWNLTPDEIDVDVAAAGLNPALTRTGSLGGAVGQVRSDTGPRFDTLDGGVAQLVDALAARLDHLGVDVRTGAEVERLEPRDGGWQVVTGEGGHEAEAVIVAVDETAARRLLAPHVRAVDAPGDDAPTQAVATLLVEAPALDARPRGTAVYALAPDAPVVAVADVTARWPWLAARGAHVVRVSFRLGLVDGVDLDRAIAAASEFLGVEIALRGGRVEWFTPAPPISQIGRVTRVEAVRAAVQAVDGLAVTGAWLAGSGLARVVPHAREEADRVRRRSLWGQPPAPQ